MGRTWVVLEEEMMGLEQEHHGSAIRKEERSRMEASSSTARRKCNTSWNQFQHDNKGKGLTMTQMRKAYYKQKNEKGV